MTQQRDIERLLDLWFSDGPTESPDRVIDVVADRIERQPQRPAWRFHLREIHVNTMLRAGIAVAAVVVVAFIAVQLLPGQSGVTGGQPSTKRVAECIPGVLRRRPELRAIPGGAGDVHCLHTQGVVHGTRRLHADTRMCRRHSASRPLRVARQAGS